MELVKNYTPADLEIFEQETNYHRFLHNHPTMVSNCCDARILGDHNEGICSECGEHCLAVPAEEF